jgi:DNA/RNA-binding domain of Phe-tRNA-synthetase-like protein
LIIPGIEKSLPAVNHSKFTRQEAICGRGAREGEMFVGLGNQSIITRSHEVVLRDHSSIWAFYTQGPNMATVVHSRTKNAMILGFFAPETSRETMTRGIREAVDNLLKAAEGEAEDGGIIP